MKKILFSVLFFISILVDGQNIGHYISGTIIDSKTQKSIPFVTIYVNGTTIGCLSNEKGEFILRDLTYPCQVVVSHLSYNTKVFNVNGNIARCKILIDMKVINLKEITIVGKGSISRKQNISRFETSFLGSDRWGRKAKLLNENVLEFTSNSQRFSVEASAPLEVALPLLGYKLKVDLVSFQIDHNEIFGGEQCSIIAFYYFIPVTPKTKKQANNISKNRHRAYYCSNLHFCRSLYNNSLSSNGYQITKGLVSRGKSISNPVQFKKEYLKDKNGLDCLKLIGYKDSSFVIYYYYKNGSPINFERAELKNCFISRLFILNDTCVIRANGTIPDNSILFSGKIGEKRVGSILPENFHP